MDRLLNTDTGNTLMSIIWGIGIAALLYSVTCAGSGECIVVKGPPMAEMQNQVYGHDNRCFQFDPYTVNCKPPGANYPQNGYLPKDHILMSRMKFFDNIYRY